MRHILCSIAPSVKGPHTGKPQNLGNFARPPTARDQEVRWPEMPSCRDRGSPSRPSHLARPRHPTSRVCPPSTVSETPVMNAASELARKTAACATSHALP